jgi:hypothetical protein
MQPSPMRELDSRRSDRIDVRLLWDALDDRLVVAVRDERTGDDFTVAVRAGERPRDVFLHPYAYATWHGAGGGGAAAPERVPVA